jgi:hypothetical protein
MGGEDGIRFNLDLDGSEFFDHLDTIGRGDDMRLLSLF